MRKLAMRRKINGVTVSIWILLNLLFTFLSPTGSHADTVFQLNEYTLKGSASFLDGWTARVGKSRIHVVIEIPTGTNQKWEVKKPGGLMVWELKEGKRRVVQYLPYPVNYGMIPQTMFSKAMGGDGDPLDVLLIGPALPRGKVVIGRIIGVLKLLDDGKQDDKLIAVGNEGPFKKIKNPKELDRKFPGTLSILETWFTNYKGSGRIESKGFAGISAAEEILNQAIQSYSEKR